MTLFPLQRHASPSAVSINALALSSASRHPGFRTVGK